MLSIRTLRWISVIVPTTFVVVFEFVTRSLYGDLVPAWGHTVVILAAVSTYFYIFITFLKNINILSFWLSYFAVRRR